MVKHKKTLIFYDKNLMVEEGFLSPNPRYLTHRVNFCSNRGMGQGWANGIMMTRIF